MGQFSDTIRRFAVASQAKAEAIRKDIIFDLFSAIIFDSAVDTGNFMANWNTSQGSPDLSFTPFGWGIDHPDDVRLGHMHAASSIAMASLKVNLGNGLKRNTRTFLSNRALGNELGSTPNEFYGGKIEYGYPHYGWDERNGKTPPSKNVRVSGYSRHAPKGMVRVNIAKIGEIVRRSVKHHGGTTA